MKGFAAGLMLSISFFDLAHNAINSIGFLKGNLWVSILLRYNEESKSSEMVNFWYYRYSYSSNCVDSSLEVLFSLLSLPVSSQNLRFLPLQIQKVKRSDFFLGRSHIYLNIFLCVSNMGIGTPTFEKMEE